MAKETVQARGIRSRKAIERTEELLDIDLQECFMKKATGVTRILNNMTKRLGGHLNYKRKANSAGLCKRSLANPVQRVEQLSNDSGLRCRKGGGVEVPIAARRMMHG